MSAFEAQIAQTLIAADAAMEVAAIKITELQRRVMSLADENARLRGMAEDESHYQPRKQKMRP